MGVVHADLPAVEAGRPASRTTSSLILEDTDGDGKADKCTVFYDKLHCPTGFEFFNGGVLVMSQPRILLLKDTDGDDKADLVVHLLDGWATDDTHHRGGFEWSHGGLLHMLEGIAMSTTLETPWGPYRSHGTGGAYVIDPRTLQGPAVRACRAWQHVVLRLRRVGPGHRRRRHHAEPGLGHAALRAPVRRPQGDSTSSSTTRASGRTSAASGSSRGTSRTTCRGSSSTPASST